MNITIQILDIDDNDRIKSDYTREYPDASTVADILSHERISSYEHLILVNDQVKKSDTVLRNCDTVKLIPHIFGG